MKKIIVGMCEGAKTAELHFASSGVKLLGLEAIILKAPFAVSIIS
jgi:hypothetical protein